MKKCFKYPSGLTRREGRLYHDGSTSGRNEIDAGMVHRGIQNGKCRLFNRPNNAIGCTHFDGGVQDELGVTSECLVTRVRGKDDTIVRFEGDELDRGSMGPSRGESFTAETDGFSRDKDAMLFTIVDESAVCTFGNEFDFDNLGFDDHHA